MKKLTIIILTALAILGQARAQGRKCPAMAGKSAACGQQTMQRPGGMMQKLDLNEQQRSSMKSLRDEKQNKLAELEKNDKITMAEYRSRREAINKEYKGKMENVLTPEQKSRIAEEKKNRSEAREKKSAERLDKMKSNLSLSDDQMNRIKEHQSKMKAKMQSIRENTTLGPEQKKMQMKQVREEGKKEMQSILTPDQLKKQKEMHDERKEKMKMHHKSGSGHAMEN
jgi:hypothetical protein